MSRKIKTITCEYCNKEFVGYRGVKYCSTQCRLIGKNLNRQKTSLQRYGSLHPAQSKIVQQKIKKTNLQRYGVENVYSSQQFKQKIKQTNLQRYGDQIITRSPIIKKRIATTNLIKYGFTSPGANPKVQQKIKKTNLQRYGAQNVFASDYGKSKIKQVFLRKYGVQHNMMNPQVRQKRNKTLFQKYGVVNGYQINQVRTKSMKSMKRISKIQLYLETLLLKFDIKYQKQYKIDKYFYDFKIDNLLIEVQGDYWHANPNRYKETDLINIRKKGRKLASDIWKRDEEKKQLAIKSGFEFLSLWQDELNTIQEIEIINKIRGILKI